MKEKGYARKYPLTDEEIGLIEESLRITLPEHYIEGVRSFKFDAIDGDNLHLTQDPTYLIKWNEDYEKHGYYSKGWRDDIFVVGSDGGGGIYFVMLDDEEPGIFYADWESNCSFSDLGAMRYASDMDAYFKKWVRMQEEYG